jgi:hypothetical protein
MVDQPTPALARPLLEHPVYEFVHHVGKGAYGSVQLCRHRVSREEVAIKVRVVPARFSQRKDRFGKETPCTMGARGACLQACVRVHACLRQDRSRLARSPAAMLSMLRYRAHAHMSVCTYLHMQLQFCRRLVLPCAVVWCKCGVVVQGKSCSGLGNGHLQLHACTLCRAVWVHPAMPWRVP